MQLLSYRKKTLRRKTKELERNHFFKLTSKYFEKVGK